MKWFKELLDEALQGPIGIVILLWIALLVMFAAFIISGALGLMP